MRLKPTVLLVFAAVTLLWPPAASAKRKAPSPVPPLIWQGVEYRAPLDLDHMGHVQAFELPSHRKLWETKVYHVWPIPLLEEDNQWVFVSGMRVQNGKLLVSNEEGKNYRLDLRTGRIEGAMRYWVPWFLAGTLLMLVAFFVWVRKGSGTAMPAEGGHRKQMANRQQRTPSSLIILP
jgi:hypothetical protein